MALVTMQGVPPSGYMQHILDKQVDDMIAWADRDNDGKISYEEVAVTDVPNRGRHRWDLYAISCEPFHANERQAGYSRSPSATRRTARATGQCTASPSRSLGSSC